MSSATPRVRGIPHPRPSRRLWRWFGAGFLVAFLALAALYPTYFYDGRSVRQTRLWQYYLLGVQRSANSTGHLGPTSGNTSAAFTVAGMHIAAASAAGAIASGIGGAVKKSFQAG